MSRPRLSASRAALLAFATLCLFCGGGGGGGGGGQAVSVSVSPKTPSIEVNQQVTINATVTGAADTSVAWQLSGGLAEVSHTDTSITVVAPASIGSGTVTASANADLTKTDASTVTFTEATGSGGGIIQ